MFSSFPKVRVRVRGEESSEWWSDEANESGTTVTCEARRFVGAPETSEVWGRPMDARHKNVWNSETSGTQGAAFPSLIHSFSVRRSDSLGGPANIRHPCAHCYKTRVTSVSFHFLELI
jgi:hypothetical protein